MNKKQQSIGAAFALGVLLIAFHIGGAGGCGGGSGTGGSTGGGTTGADDSTVEATSDDANNSGTAAFNASNDALTAALAGGGASLIVADSKDEILEAFKNALTITAATSCDEGTLPSPSGDFTGTISGSTSGSCSVTADVVSGATTDVSALIDCDNFNDGVDAGEATIDGSIGFEASVTSGSSTTSIDFTITSQDLLVTLSDGDNCSVVIDLGFGVTTTVSGSTASTTFDATGCVSVCGEAFSVSGSETL